jgi:hypothetical protein
MSSKIRNRKLFEQHTIVPEAITEIFAPVGTCEKKAYEYPENAPRVTSDGKPLRAYRCPFCNWYHVTSKLEQLDRSNSGRHRRRAS